MYLCVIDLHISFGQWYLLFPFPPADGMSVATHRMESSGTVTQQVTKEYVTRTMMQGGSLSRQVERQFYEA